MTINELREKRAQQWEAAKNFLNSHRTEKGTLTAEDDASYTAMEQEIADLGKEIARMEQRLKELDELFLQPEHAANMELVTEYTHTRQVLEHANEQWMELSEELEALQSV